MRKKSPPRRSNCPMSYALDFVGDKWTLLVLRDLIMSRKQYFQDLLESDEKIASNILASRLKQLEAAGMITRANDPAHGRRVIYSPTAKALDLLPAMLELVRWSAAYDARTGVPSAFVRRIAGDRDVLVDEIRSRHGIGNKRAQA
jgi:DNA-binding HxlR family transcriptional regulator